MNESIIVKWRKNLISGVVKGRINLNLWPFLKENHQNNENFSRYRFYPIAFNFDSHEPIKYRTQK